MSESFLKNRKPTPERVYEAKTRLCLMCRNSFVSEWPGERVCRNCKSRAKWREATTAISHTP